MPPERRLVLLFLGLAVGGQALRAWLVAPGDPPGAVALVDLPEGSPVRAHRDSGIALARPLGPGELVDLDRAPAVEIARLPRVGMRLAKAIVAHREAHGPFGSLEAVDAVPGVGPALLAAMAGKVRFTAPPRPLPGPGGRAAASAGAAPPVGPGPSPSGPLNLNQASAAELERLPFIGPYMAGQIVAYREKHGPFAAVDSLVRVPGVGPATLRRVREHVTAP